MQLGHECWGSGATAVIVLNDWMSDTSSWNGARPYLDRVRYTWVFTDLRGYGRSRELKGAYDLQEAVQDVVELIAARGFQRVAIVGHSMSCLVALQLAQRHPSRVIRTVVITPPPPAGFGAPRAVLEQSQQLALASDDVRRRALHARFAERLGEGWVSYKTQQWRETSDPQAVSTYAAMFTCQGLPDVLTPIDVPVLAITGEHDYPPLRSEATRASLTPLCAKLTVQALGDSGHYPMQEMPPRLVALIEHFLADAS
jgi:pimeloyl-ACP methyl ester carboxylesterase